MKRNLSIISLLAILTLFLQPFTASAAMKLKSDETYILSLSAFAVNTTNYYVLKSDKSLWTYGANDAYLHGNGEIYLSGDYPPKKILDNVRTATK